MQGRILKGIAGFYYVHVAGSGIYECKAKGIFRLQGIKPLVGDLVEIDVIDEAGKEGNIVSILPRKNELVRPAVANLDLALIVFAAAKPDPNFGLLDRLLVLMARQNVPVCICFNKSDLADGDRRREYADIYAGCGSPVEFISVKTGEGVDWVMDRLRGMTAAIAGPSGAGKSSLINRLQPLAGMETGGLSKKIDRGRQTTRHVQLVHIEGESYIADTPGFSSLYLPQDMRKEELRRYYPEFAPYEDFCRFKGCSHVGENDCGVKRALEAGQIARSRYDMYVQLYRELGGRAR